MSEWREVSLGTVVESVSETFKFTDEQVVFLNTSDILADKFLHADFSDPKTLPGQAKKRIKKGDLLFSEIRPANKRYALVNFDSDDYVVSTKLMVLRSKGNIDPTYLKLFLTSEETLEYLQMIAEDRSGTFPQITFDILDRMNLMVPPLLEQKAIASVISSLDDKIDLLHRQNTILERMAETLFRQWFVEEAQGDWEECTLDNLISIKGGTTPSTKEPQFWDGNICWTSPRDLSNHQSVFMFSTERKITEKGLAKIGSGLLPIGTVLMSSRAPIGYLAITDIPVAINQGYIAIVCDKLVSNYFMFLWCKVNMEQIKNAGNGSTFEEISKSNFKALSTLKPSKEAILKFDASAKPIFAKIRTNQQQIQTLEKLRDNLLPKLMSGEVRVNLPHYPIVN